MMTSIYSAVSGLKSQQTKLNVIGNNIANVNTIGYKAQTVTFSDLLSQTISGATAANTTTGTGGTNAKQIGTGASVASTTTLTTVGSTQSTGNDTDVAISGSGYYIVQGGGTGEYQFTRAGNFGVDADGNLTVNGYNICGWSDYTLDAEGNYIFDTDTQVEPLNLFSDGKQVLAAEQTETSTLTGSIDSSADAHATQASPKVVNQAVMGTDANATANLTGLNDTTAVLGSFYAGTVSINGTSVTIEATDTIDSLMAKINALSATTGVTAEFDSGDGVNGYIKLISTDTGTSAKIKLAGADTTLEKLFAAETATNTSTGSSGTVTANAVGTAAAATTNKTGLSATTSTVSSSLAGSVTISSASGTAATVTITSGESISNIVKAINAQTTTTGVTASFITNSGNGYIQLTSTSGNTVTLSGSDAALQGLFAAETVASNTVTGTTTLGDATIATGNLTGLTASTSTASARMAGSITLNSTNGTSSTIAITSGETISSIISAINSSSAGVTASFVTNSGNGYIQLTSNTTGDTVTLTGTEAVLEGIFAVQATTTDTATGADASITANALGTAATATTNAAGLTTASTAGATYSGDISINDTTISIASTDTLAQIVAKINAQSSTTGVTAEFITNSGNGYIQLTDATGDTISLEGSDAIVQDIFAAATSSTDSLSTTGLAADGTTTLTVYDAQGNSYEVAVNLYKSYVDSSDASNPVTYWYWEADTSADNATISGSGYIAFDSEGNIITTNDAYDATPTITLTPANTVGTAPFQISLDMTDITAQADTDSLTNTSDGYEAGTLESFTIGSDGTITGVYDNGYTQPLGVIALATFTNPAGLLKLGNGLYSTTVNSGEFTGGVVAGSGGTGSLSAGSLEMSNVDLSEQFSEMMITQRAYQANSKVISASDECLQAVINMI